MGGETDLEEFRRHAREEFGLIIDLTADGKISNSLGESKVWRATIMEDFR